MTMSQKESDRYIVRFINRCFIVLSVFLVAGLVVHFTSINPGNNDEIAFNLKLL